MGDLFAIILIGAVTTLSLSFASVEQQSALAADVLRVCSLLHPDAIPEGGFFPPGSRPPGTSPGRHRG